MEQKQQIDQERIQRLIDRQDILDCLTRYTRGVDRLDRDILLSAYHPDARDDHGVFVGTAAEFADWVFNAHRHGQQKTMHVIANHSCTFESDRQAHTETYCIYYGFNRDETIDLVGNRYLDRMEKRGGEWRIADRICVVEWYGSLKNADEMDSVIKPSMAALMSNAPSSRNREDISYKRPLVVEREGRIPAPMPL